MLMTSTAADFYYDVYVSGSTNLTGPLVLNTKLDPQYILTSTGSLTSNIMGYLVNVSSDVQTQINAKQNIFLNNVSNTWTSNISNYNYDFRRSDTNGQNFYIGNSNTVQCSRAIYKNIIIKSCRC